MITDYQPSTIRRSLRLGQQERLRITVEDPQDDSEAHDHLFHEIAFIQKGSANHHTATGVGRIKSGDLIIIRPQVWHAYLQCRNLVVVNCLFNSPLLYQLLPLLADSPQMTDLLRLQQQNPTDATPVVLHAKSGMRKKIETLLSHMMHEQNKQRSAWQSSCTADLLQLFVLIARLYGESSRPMLSASSDAAILAAAHHIEAHFTESLSLAALAEIAGVSRGHLSRHFSLRMGMGVVDYQHRLRIEEACRLLRLTGLSITQIAVRVGYSEVAYFSRCFKRMMGLGARDYRHGKHSTISKRRRKSR